METANVLNQLGDEVQPLLQPPKKLRMAVRIVGQSMRDKPRKKSRVRPHAVTAAHPFLSKLRRFRLPVLPVEVVNPVRQVPDG